MNFDELLSNVVWERITKNKRNGIYYTRLFQYDYMTVFCISYSLMILGTNLHKLLQFWRQPLKNIKCKI